MKVRLPLWLLLAFSVAAFCGSLVLFLVLDREPTGASSRKELSSKTSDPRSWLLLADRFAPREPLVPDSPVWNTLSLLLRMNETDISEQDYAMKFLSYYWSLPVDRTASPCEWDGVTCSGNTVTGIEAPSEWTVFGALPNELFFLTGLQTLRLSGQDIWYGLEPVYRLSNLQVLDLSGNRVTQLTSGIGNLTNLRELNLRGNNIEGTLPAEIALLTNMEDLSFNSNPLLEGDIYQYISSWRRLKSLDVSSTLIRGSLPTEIGLLTDLESLITTLSPLEGQLPIEISQCTALTELRIDGAVMSSGLVGNLDWISSLSNLIAIAVGPGRLTTIPSEIGLLSKLSYVDFRDTGLSGTIPTEIGSLSNLQFLQLSDNPMLSGSIPTEVKSMESLSRIFLLNVNLSGTMPLCELNRRFIDIHADCDCIACREPPVTCPCCNFCTRK